MDAPRPSAFPPPRPVAAVDPFRRPLIPVLCALTGGILLGHHFRPDWLSPTLLAAALLLPAGLLLLPLRRKAFPLLSLFCLTGMLLDSQAHPPASLGTLAQSHPQPVIEGTVLGTLRALEGYGRYEIRTQAFHAGGRSWPVAEKLVLSVYEHAPELAPGDLVRFPARLRPLRNFNNPGRYDLVAAMGLRGISWSASLSDGRLVVPMGPGSLPPPARWLEKSRQPVRSLAEGGLKPENAALFRALILGERHRIAPAARELFDRTGLGHVLAVSGLHIGLVAWAAFALLHTLLAFSGSLAARGCHRRLAAALTCLPVVVYAGLAGFQISAQRAMIMVLAFLASLLLQREKEAWSTLALAGIVILFLDPHALYSVSFQLSFGAVIGILWLTPGIYSRLCRSTPALLQPRSFATRALAYLLGLIAVSLSATLILLPLIASHFHRLSLVTLPANVSVVPVLGLWVIPAALSSALVCLFSPALAAPLLYLTEKGLDLMNSLIRFWAALPKASLWVPTPSLAEGALFYLLLIGMLYWKRSAWARAAAVTALLCTLAVTGFWIQRLHFNRDLSVTYLDVGQGNAALLEFPNGKRMLIDGGGFSRSHFDVGRMVVAPYLWHRKIMRVDYLVLSHPQADHLNGLPFIARAFGPAEFWHNGQASDSAAFRELLHLMHSRNAAVLTPAELAAGRRINGVEVELLHPLPDPPALSRNALGTNDLSLVLKITWRGTSFLFAGDIEGAGERVLIAGAGPRLESQVFLAAHHGSRNANSPELLRRVKAQLCVVSAGARNAFGFPHPETLRRLADAGCRILRTDQHGAIRVRVGNNGLEVETFLPY